MSSVGDYKTKLKTLLDAIVFDSSTLGAKGIVKKRLQSENDKAHTNIYIFSGQDGSRYQESKTNKRTHPIVIRIVCTNSGREDSAQDDMDTLVEEILTVLEQNLDNISWSDGYLNQTIIASTNPRVSENFLIKDILFTIVKRVEL